VIATRELPVRLYRGVEEARRGGQVASRARQQNNHCRSTWDPHCPYTKAREELPYAVASYCLRPTLELEKGRLPAACVLAYHGRYGAYREPDLGPRN
jgi:hypothetical protein